jgi:hypothetical protein
MDRLTRDDLRALLSQWEGPCVSLFQPTHRGGAEQDPIRWKNLLGEAAKRLEAAGLRAPEARKLLGPARRLLEDPSFWRSQSDGLACFLSRDGIRSYRLPVSFAELVVVADRFHVKPLLPLLSSNGRFYVLAVSQKRVRLLQGSAHRVREVDLKGVPTSLAQALQFHDRDEPLLFHTRPAGGADSWAAIFHGQGVGIDDVKDDLLRYFQQIDRGLHELLRDERAPLVLAAVEYLWPIYHQANTYPHLLERGIAGNPDHLSAKELHNRAWALVQPHFQKAQEEAVALYTRLAGTGSTSNDLEEIVRAAHQGRIEVLFVTSGQERWGTFAAAEERLQLHERAEPGDEDLLNLAAVHTLAHGGTVYVVPASDVPGGGTAAGIFWLPFARKSK